MEYRGRGWTGLSGTLLIVGMSHGWALALGILGILVMTYGVAYFFISVIKDQNTGGVIIITPFLTIRTQPLDRPDSQDSSNPPSK